ncbi:MAG TPA: hypothetical protein VJA86_02360, partial [Candidatus Nanoarchaeia archaeon]|nr:hypothetical protein [Candidatus Nanoarchaeia archaeon]
DLAGDIQEAEGNTAEKEDTGGRSHTQAQTESRDIKEIFAAEENMAASPAGKNTEGVNIHLGEGIKPLDILTAEASIAANIGEAVIRTGETEDSKEAGLRVIEDKRPCLVKQKEFSGVAWGETK